jgi:hypothetical protein
MKVEIVPVCYTWDSSFDFTLDLREIDKREARAFMGVEPMRALILTLVESHESWAIMQGDKVQGFFGVCLGDGYGIPWFVSNKELIQNKKLTFIKRSKKIVDKMLKTYGKLLNYVTSENTASIKWLKWLGFTIHLKEERFYDPDIFFRKFEMKVGD